MKTAVHRSSGSTAHEKALQARHADLAVKIEKEQNHPFINYMTLKKMKLEKLRLKEMIERIRDE